MKVGPRFDCDEWIVIENCVVIGIDALQYHTGLFLVHKDRTKKTKQRNKKKFYRHHGSSLRMNERRAEIRLRRMSYDGFCWYNRVLEKTHGYRCEGSPDGDALWIWRRWMNNLNRSAMFGCGLQFDSAQCKHINHVIRKLSRAFCFQFFHWVGLGFAHLNSSHHQSNDQRRRGTPSASISFWFHIWQLFIFFWCKQINAKNVRISSVIAISCQLHFNYLAGIHWFLSYRG